MHKSLRTLLIAAITIALAGTATAQNVLRIAQTSGPPTLDAHFNPSRITGDIAMNVFEGLVGYGEDLSIRPQLAESWTISDDGLLYTFTLHEGVEFHNGEVLSADDVLASLERVLAISPEQARFGSISGINVVDDRTIELVLSEPNSVLLQALAATYAVIMPRSAIDGVPGTHAPIMIEFLDVAGSSCGALFPTGNFVDEVAGLKVSMVDNGMPCVLIDAADLGLQGDESIAELEGNQALRERIEALRLEVGPLMNLGDVRDKTVPKMFIVSPAQRGGLVNTRSFIPHRVHEAIGVLAAASVAAAVNIPGAVGHAYANIPSGRTRLCEVEHPTGSMGVEVVLDENPEVFVPASTSIMRTARLLMAGNVYYLERQA